MAYFPAISLSFKESVAFNFGSRPLRYPLGVGRGGLKGEEPVLKPSLEAVEYTYVTAGCFLLFALGRRAGSRREPPGQNHWAHKHQCWSLGVSEMRHASALKQQLLLQRGAACSQALGSCKDLTLWFWKPECSCAALGHWSLLPPSHMGPLTWYQHCPQLRSEPSWLCLVIAVVESFVHPSGEIRSVV